jgi:hypothetical protein
VAWRGVAWRGVAIDQYMCMLLLLLGVGLRSPMAPQLLEMILKDQVMHD